MESIIKRIEAEIASFPGTAAAAGAEETGIVRATGDGIGRDQVGAEVAMDPGPAGLGMGSRYRSGKRK